MNLSFVFLSLDFPVALLHQISFAGAPIFKSILKYDKAAPGWHIVEDPWAGVVSVDGPAAAGGGPHDAGEQLGVEAELDAEVHGLRGPDHRHRQQHVVADLHRAARAHPAAVRHLVSAIVRDGWLLLGRAI